MKFLFNKRFISVTVLVLALFTSCGDYHDLNLEPVNSGDADFSSYVAVGNSLTAGVQHATLYAAGQEFSFPNLLARQFRIEESFTQPLISAPGIGSGGRIELTDLDPITLTQSTEPPGQPLNQDQKPYTNLGIPGAVLVDFLNPDSNGDGVGDGDLKERATNPSHPAFNPFYSIVLESSELAKSAPNIFNQLVKQEPTFITFWLGNNDVLGYVLDGGEGRTITDPVAFGQLYINSAQALASTGADVVVYNIPDVTTIPYVFYLRAELENEGAIAFNDQTQTYQLATPQGSFDILIETDDGIRPMGEFDFPLFSATPYFEAVQNGEAAPPVTPADALSDELVLDGPAGGTPGSSELEQAAGAVLQYNITIESTASTHGFALVDIHSFFTDIISNFQSSGGTGGYETNGLTLRPVPGELFGFDAVHPGNRGYAVLANETIKVINDTFGSNLPLINVGVIPEGLPVSSE